MESVVPYHYRKWKEFPWCGQTRGDGYHHDPAPYHVLAWDKKPRVSCLRAIQCLPSRPCPSVEPCSGARHHVLPCLMHARRWPWTHPNAKFYPSKRRPSPDVGWNCDHGFVQCSRIGVFTARATIRLLAAHPEYLDRIYGFASGCILSSWLSSLIFVTFAEVDKRPLTWMRISSQMFIPSLILQQSFNRRIL